MVEFSHFMGQDGFHWFVGVVEDRIDPSALGRVRVRCLGYHSSDVVQLPTTELPWAHVMHPVTDPCMQGMGNSPSFLVEGSYVVGSFVIQKSNNSLSWVHFLAFPLSQQTHHQVSMIQEGGQQNKSIIVVIPPMAHIL